MSSSPPVVVAVDGGGSKTDVAVVDLRSGTVLSTHRGPGCSHHSLGIPAAVKLVDTAVTHALSAAGAVGSDVVHAGCYLTSIDMPDEGQAVRDALSSLAWASRSVDVDNDVFALLRAGTNSDDAAVVVCGTGINGAAVRSDGATARILAFGHVSGDWGGASGLAEEVLWHAARAEDGRGQPTALREALLVWTGHARVQDVILAVHRRELSVEAWWSRTPEIFALAQRGDAVAASLVDRQGAEIGLLAASLLARLGLSGSAVPVVIGGGVGSSGDARLVAAVRGALLPIAPLAELSIVAAAPIQGAVQLALSRARGQRRASAGPPG